LFRGEAAEWYGGGVGETSAVDRTPQRADVRRRRRAERRRLSATDNTRSQRTCSDDDDLRRRRRRRRLFDPAMSGMIGPREI